MFFGCFILSIIYAAISIKFVCVCVCVLSDVRIPQSSVRRFSTDRSELFTHNDINDNILHQASVADF